MSSFVATFLIIGIASSIFIVSFSEQIKGVVLDVLIRAVSHDISPTPSAKSPVDEQQSQTASTTPKWVPPGFNGPTGKPHIIGPSSNPPNY